MAIAFLAVTVDGERIGWRPGEGWLGVWPYLPASLATMGAMVSR